MKTVPKHIQSLVFIAGLSGAGKSSAADVFADLGYYVVDNLPIPLVETFIQFTETDSSKFSRIALLVNASSAESTQSFLELLGNIRDRTVLIYVDCSTGQIIRRYSETRRPHPTFNPEIDPSLESTIQRERTELMPILEKSNFIIDTSNYSIHDFRRSLRDIASKLPSEPSSLVRVNFVSFGFKYGIPRDCDLLVDVRFLPNPYFEEELRPLSGLDALVRDYVMSFNESGEFIDRYVSLIDFLLPKYIHEGKAYLNIGIGCTGGRHRSVAISEALCNRFKGDSLVISTKHRDISRKERDSLDTRD